MNDEIKEWLEKEIEVCEKGRLDAIETAECAINQRDYYSRRKEFLNKILNLIEE